MPESLQQLGWLTPNTWALEAYSGIFWRQDSLLEIWPPLGAMLGTAVLSWLAANWIAQVRVYGRASESRRRGNAAGAESQRDAAGRCDHRAGL